MHAALRVQKKKKKNRHAALPEGFSMDDIDIVLSDGSIVMRTKPKTLATYKVSVEVPVWRHSL